MKYPNIEAERARMGLTVARLARELGVVGDTYRAWIAGNEPIPLTACVIMGDLLKCSVDYLLSPRDELPRWVRYRRVQLPHGA